MNFKRQFKVGVCHEIFDPLFHQSFPTQVGLNISQKCVCVCCDDIRVSMGVLDNEKMFRKATEGSRFIADRSVSLSMSRFITYRSVILSSFIANRSVILSRFIADRSVILSSFIADRSVIFVQVHRRQVCNRVQLHRRQVRHLCPGSLPTGPSSCPGSLPTGPSSCVRVCVRR